MGEAYNNAATRRSLAIPIVSPLSVGDAGRITAWLTMDATASGGWQTLDQLNDYERAVWPIGSVE